MDLFYSFFSSCFPSPALKINTHTYKVQHEIGTGGFSTVYLITSQTNTYALKKIICQRGTPEQLALAKREISAYQRFNSPNIIKLTDYEIQASSNGTKLVYIVLPYYKQGTLADLVEYNKSLGTRVPEQSIIAMFRGICSALECMHNFVPPSTSSEQIEDTSDESVRDPSRSTRPGYAPVQECADETVAANSEQSVAAYAHRDVKLANVLLSDTDTPVLMDLGSVAPARAVARTRNDALRIQDDAAEHCTMAYRAPELFDVQRGAVFDERTDIWSLGCLLFALAYARTPFEDPEAGPGASVALAAMNGRYSFPDADGYSPNLRKLIEYMLVPEMADRPFIGQVIEMVDTLYP